MGVDPDGSTWGLIQLQRFLEELRRDTQRDATASLEVARRRAELRLVEAHQEAEWIRGRRTAERGDAAGWGWRGSWPIAIPNGTGAAAAAPNVEPWPIRDASDVTIVEEAPGAHEATPPVAPVPPIEPEPRWSRSFQPEPEDDVYTNGVGPTLAPDVGVGVVADQPQSPREGPPTLLPVLQPNVYETVFWSDPGDGNGRVEAAPPPPPPIGEPPPADLSEPAALPKRPPKARYRLVADTGLGHSRSCRRAPDSRLHPLAPELTARVERSCVQGRRTLKTSNRLVSSV